MPLPLSLPLLLALGSIGAREVLAADAPLARAPATRAATAHDVEEADEDASDDEAGPALSAFGLTLEGGSTRSADGAYRTPYLATELFVGVQATDALELELSYEVEKREGRGPSHFLKLEGALAVSEPLTLRLSLEAAPPGGSDPGVYCLPIAARVQCVDATERLRSLAPQLGAEYETDPERDVVGLFEASASTTLYRLEYLPGPDEPASQHLRVGLQEYRVDARVTLDVQEHLELGVDGSLLHLHGALPQAAEEDTQGREAPAELPLAPPRYVLGARVGWAFTPAFSARLKAEYAPYQERCFGSSRAASLQLTALPGRLRLFAEGTLQRDVSPTDAGTLAACGLSAPDPDYVSTSLRAGFDFAF
ncbi:hypothetical protein FGE12_23200 [Aggregicoccus sp. 17bor-14]|uniref:hypothetical protein n=1 Tax=Myxococcaceae TaxID=31 RepID=UPI00129CAF1D|nr:MULTISPECIES: hypothetical protein [Myxococcaceae]MBF5045331.1 hypothetical protein [Simulacricoccus sp. 17bor-14]MRI91073.1 hypothetical protein [Aggregicoccus sp. 17bor-14]